MNKLRHPGLAAVVTGVLFFSICFPGYAQTEKRSLTDLIIKDDPGWTIVQQWIDSASNEVVVLPTERKRAEDCLLQTQVTTRSPMGAIILHTGGILVDHGWLRILGSGSDRFKRTLPGWNKTKYPSEPGEPPAALLVADDAAGGFFLINGGALGSDPGKMYYLSPDNLRYEPLDLTYSEFLRFCFSGNLGEFYQGIRWKSWIKDVGGISGDQMFNPVPPLWSKEGNDPDQVRRKPVPAEEQYHLSIATRKTLRLE